MHIFKNNFNLKKEIEIAKRKGYAIGQFNFSSLEQLQGIAKASKKTGYPVICGTSSGEANFVGIEEAVSLVRSMREKENIPMFLNFDHGKDFEELKVAIDAGYDMVHIDASLKTFEESIAETKKVVSYAKKKKVLVEGEFAKIGGKSSFTGEKIEKTVLTSIDKVVKFVEQTGVDLVALDVGNVHGIHAQMPELSLERISIFLESCNFAGVVLHGGSGIEKHAIREAVRRGVMKININTEIRKAWRDSVFYEMTQNEEQITPYKILPFAREEVYKKVKEKIEIFKT